VRLAAVTVYCTAMIYASLKAIDAWHTPLTPACYLLFSAGGRDACWHRLLRLGMGGGLWVGLALAVLFLLAAWVAKLAWRNRLQRRPRSTPETATGLGAIGKVRLFEPPHINDNYLTSEMGFRIARKHASKLFRIAFAAGCVAPGPSAFIALLLGPAVRAVMLGLAVLLLRGGRAGRALAVLRRGPARGHELLLRQAQADQRLWNHIHWAGSSRTQRSTTSLRSWAVAGTSTMPSGVRGSSSRSSTMSR
jgi:DMSO reductase anchor subunit